MSCIFCNSTIGLNSIEHIVPESLGNQWYMLSKGEFCSTCNNRFSKFENTALNNSILGLERARLGIKTKNGNPGIGNSSDIKFTGSDTFERGLITISGLRNAKPQLVDAKKGLFEITVPSFTKSENASAKLFLKIGFESLYKSRSDIFNKYNFMNLLNCVLGNENLL